MGQLDVLTHKQQLIFQEVINDSFLHTNFYFTGGTALSAFYLHHRESDDLDFFSENTFDSQILLAKVGVWAKKHKFTFDFRKVEDLYVFELLFPDKETLKVDFNHYPYKRLEKGLHIETVVVDSIFDIATNKLITVIQRSEVKDFVDLYFLLKQYTVWDLMHTMQIKFGNKTDPFLIASDFMKVEEFDFLPRMIVPFSLNELKTFFREKARELAKKVVV